MKKIILSVLLVIGMCLSAQAATGSWNSNTSASWTNAALWTGGVPTNAGDIAYITNNINATRTITISSIITNGAIYIGDINNTSHPFVIGGAAGTNVFDNGSNDAILTQLAGSKGDTISVAEIKLNSNLAITNLSTANALTISSVITGNKAVSVAGGGVVTLSGENSYSGGTVLNYGTLNLNSTNALGTGTFTINGGSINNTSAAAIVMTNNNALTINSNFTFIGFSNRNLDLGAGDVTLGTAAGTSRAITVTANTLTLDGNIANGNTANQLIKDGAGTLILNGANTFTGGLVIKKGVANLGAPSGISTAAGTGAITLGDAAGGDAYLSTGSLTVTNDINLASGAVGSLSIGSTGATRIPIYTGAIALNGNNLIFDTTGSSTKLKNYGAITGTGNLVLSNQTTDSGYILLGSNTVNNTGTISSYSAGTNTLGNQISANIGGNVTGITVTRGMLTLSGTNSYTGETTIGSTATLSVGKDSLGGTNVNLNQNSVLATTGDVTTSGGIKFENGSPSIDVAAGTTFTVNGVVGGSSISPNKTGTGTLVLNNANNFADKSIFLMKQGTLKLGNDAALNGTTLKFNPLGSFLDNSKGSGMVATGLQGLEMTVGFTFTGTDDLDLSAAQSSFVQTATTARNIIVTAKTLTIGGILTTGTDYTGTARVDAGLTKSGAGTLVIAGDSDYTLGTTVSAGVLQVGKGGTSGTLGTGNIANNASLAFNRSDELTVGSLISGTGTLTQAGSGTLTLTNANSYSGTTTISAGTLKIGNGGTSGTLGTSNVVNNAALAFNRSDALTVGNLISGTGTLTQAGSGVLTLTNANTHSGGTTLAAGTLRVGNNAALGIGALAINSGTLSATGTTARTISNSYAIGGDATLGNATDSGALTFSGTGNLGTAMRTLTVDSTVSLGALTNSGGITKAGAGALTLSGANTYGGGTVLSTGKLSLGNNAALGTGALTINGGTLDVTAARTTSNNNAINLNGDFNFVGTSTLNTGTGAVTLGGNRQVTVDASTLTVGGVIGDGGNTYSLTKAGAGTLALAGANTYGGTTTISGGTLQVGAGSTSGTLGGGNVINNGTLTFNRTDAQTVTNDISGTGSLFNAGPTGGINLYLTGNINLDGDFGWLTSGRGSIYTASLGNGNGNIKFFQNDALHTTASITTTKGIILNGGTTANQDLYVDSGTFTVGGLVSDTTAATYASFYNWRKLGTGTLVLTNNANTFNDRILIGNGTLSVSSIGNIGSASALGRASDAQMGTIGIGSGANTGGLTYTGTGDTSDRVIDLAGDAGGATLDQSGTGLLKFTSDLKASGAGAKTLVLQGSSAGTGELGGAIVNSTSATALKKEGTGKWTLSGANTYSGGTIISNGTLALSGSGTLGNGANALTVSTNSAGVAATLDLGGLSRTVGAVTLTGGTITNGTLTATSYALVNSGIISANLGGTGVSLLKDGSSGNLTLTGNNTFSGDFGWSSSGSSHIYVNSDAAMGTGSNIRMYQNNRLHFTEGLTTAKNLTLGGAANAAQFIYAEAGTSTVSGVISDITPVTGWARWYADGAGTLVLNNDANSFGEATYVRGTLSISSIKDVNGGNSALGNVTNVTQGTIGLGYAGTGGKLIYTGAGDTSDRVIDLVGTTGGATLDQSGTGLLKFTSALAATGNGAKTLTLQGSTAGIGELAGAIVDNPTNVAAFTSVRKDGAGIWKLSGNSTYTGTTTVAAGTLVVDGNNSAATGTLTVDATATLMGSGIIGGATTVNGMLKPGNSPGTLTFDQALTLAATSKTTFEIAGANLYDILANDGGDTITFTDGAEIIFNTAGYTVNVGDKFQILSNWNLRVVGSSVVFSGTDLGNGKTLDTSMLASDGYVTVIPEPATIGMLGLGALVTLLIRRVRTV